MRRVVLAAVFVALSFCLLVVGPATAGGPTSVLLVAPGDGRATALYTGSPKYEQLVALLDAYNQPQGSLKPPAGAGDGGPAGTDDVSGAGVTLTWLMHDVQVWRIDRVYPDARGGPLISTQQDFSSGLVSASPIVWHRAARPQVLTRLLDRLGVGSPATAATRTTSGGADPSPDRTGAGSVADSPASTPASAGRSGPALGGWGYGALGLLLGVGSTLTLRRRRPRSEADRDDAGPGPAAESWPAAAGSPPRETLASPGPEATGAIRS